MAPWESRRESDGIPASSCWVPEPREPVRPSGADAAVAGSGSREDTPESSRAGNGASSSRRCDRETAPEHRESGDTAGRPVLRARRTRDRRSRGSHSRAAAGPPAAGPTSTRLEFQDCASQPPCVATDIGPLQGSSRKRAVQPEKSTLPALSLRGWCDRKIAGFRRNSFCRDRNRGV